MSGTKGRADELSQKLAAAGEKQSALNENRVGILQAIGNFMQAKYGDDSFVIQHPLIRAVFGSLGGGVIDLEQLADDVANWVQEDEADV